MTDGALGLAGGHGTGNPYLTAILTAQRVNRLSGGAIVTPWTVGQLDETWLDAFAALENEVPKIQRGIGKIEARKAEIRAEAMRRK